MDLNGSKWPSLHMTYDTEKSAIGHSPLANQRCFSSTFSKLFWAWASSVANDDFVDGAENHRSDQGSFEAADLRGKQAFDKNKSKIKTNHFWISLFNGQHKKDRIASMVELQRTNLTTPRRERELQSEHTMNGFQHGPTLIPATPPQPAA